MTLQLRHASACSETVPRHAWDITAPWPEMVPWSTTRCALTQAGISAACRKIPLRIEPKTYFALERTYLSWMHMAVMMGGITSALVSSGFSQPNTELHDWNLLSGNSRGSDDRARSLLVPEARRPF